ncbi:MerR family transcriptional regulator [Acetonema longum]|uniref:MerR family transcriptional regulator n=1 Tax=Acetonema longum DSM 6540 TaxID=1009370 RepID=F7NJU8_9FIRM|nr:MerR family transcriptional regulator [Acetonema longum]EGO63680.1 MerR family transcriptional regulator [Acetonema longum DSM 6540]
MELRFTSGQVCKIFGITKQTLLFYDKAGILKPRDTNQKTGYRYYMLDQFDLLYLILSLRETGVPLKEIKDLLDQRTVNKTMTILENQISEIQKKIANLQVAKNRLYQNLTYIKELETLKALDQFRIKAVPEQYLLAMPVQYVNGIPDYNLTLLKITERIASYSIPFYWKVGCIPQLDPSENREEVMFVVLDSVITDPYVKLKPAGNYLCTYHYGLYDTLGNTYEKLFDYVKSNHLMMTGDIYEIYIINNLITADENSYITEISVTIEME